MTYRLWRIGQVLLTAALLVGGASNAVAEPAAVVVSIEGAAYAQRVGSPRPVILAVGSELAPGDVVHTGRDSTARIRFSDSAQLAVRPNSSLAIDDYQFVPEKPQDDSLILRIIKGGLRQVTGAIGKRGNPDAYQLKAPTATLGIRGTDFTARLCGAGECRADGPPRTVAAASERPISNNPRPVSARVLSVTGKTTATEVTGVVRPLSAGAPIYAGDVIETDNAGPAAIVLLDETKLVIDRNSSFKLTEFHFVREQPQSDNVAVGLLKGAMRMVTGLVGKRSADKVSVKTATATLGIRGTSFDVLCGPGDIADENNPPAERLAGQACDETIYTLTRDGAITLKTGDAAELVLVRGEAGVATRDATGGRRLPAVPAALSQRDWPTPESLRPDMPQLFGEEGRETQDPGVYLLVREGEVLMSPAMSRPQLFHAGESGRVTPEGTQVIRYATTPSFLERDWTMSDRVIGFGVCRP